MGQGLLNVVGQLLELPQVHILFQGKESQTCMQSESTRLRTTMAANACSNMERRTSNKERERERMTVRKKSRIKRRMRRRSRR